MYSHQVVYVNLIFLSWLMGFTNSSYIAHKICKEHQGRNEVQVVYIKKVI